MNRSSVAAVIVFMLLAASGVFAGGNKEQNTQKELPAIGGYKTATTAGVQLQWKIEGPLLRIILTSRTTGWVAVGFSPSRQMKDANIVIGYVKNGQVYLRDEFGTAPTSHSPDTANGGTSSFSNAEGTEVDGTTTISFSIPLDSGDQLDKPLVAGNTYTILLAHGNDGSDNFGDYHGDRGSLEITL